MALRTDGIARPARVLRVRGKRRRGDGSLRGREAALLGQGPPPTRGSGPRDKEEQDQAPKNPSNTVGMRPGLRSDDAEAEGSRCVFFPLDTGKQ